MAKRNLEIEAVLVLSTQHMPESEPDFGGARAAPHVYGYTVFLSTWGMSTPEWLQPLVAMALHNSCAYINFDSAGPVVEGLKTWDW